MGYLKIHGGIGTSLAWLSPFHEQRRWPQLAYCMVTMLISCFAKIAITHTSPTSLLRRNIGVRALLTLHRVDALQLKHSQMLGGCLLGDLKGDATFQSRDWG